MRTCGKIVVVRVQGKTTGGGVGIACAADYCFATKDASLALPIKFRNRTFCNLL
jgi:methylglutaconyl-CoA hydratase